MRLSTLGLGGALLTALLLILLFPPFDFRPLSAFALAPLLFAMAHEPRWRWRALWGWLAGTLYWGATCSWIQGVLNVHGGLNLALSILALVLFALIKGLHLAVFASLGGAFLKRAWGLLAIPALWTGLERTHSFLGFTWLQLGNAAIDMSVPLRAAPWAGVYGPSFVLAAMSAGLAWVLLRKPRRELVWLAPLAGLLLLPALPPDQPPKAAAVALQPNLNDDSLRERNEFENGIKKLALATLGEAINPAAPAPDLVLWPETPGPFYYFRDAFFRETVTQIARLSNAPFIFGTVLWTPQGAPLNSAIQLEADGRLAGRYDKMNLVPFGEYVPPLFGWVNKVSQEAGDFAPGEKIVLFPTARGTVGPFICYESAFPSHIRQIANQGAHVLVNLTNDGYFLRGPARRQHLLLARMRAVENRRWLLRPTNDGQSASITPTGRLVDAFPEYTVHAGRLHFDWIREKTFYTAFGDAFAWACLAAAAVLRIVAELPNYG